MKTSRYLYRFTGYDDHRYICSGLTGTIIKDPGVSLVDDSWSPADRKFLEDYGFLVPDGVDERELFSENARVRTEKDALELTVMLHEDCNFRCTYCTQDFKNKKLDDVNLDSLQAFISRMLPERGYLAMHLYGGEPLLAWQQLIKTIRRSRDTCRNKSARFSFFITTNGSLLSRQRARILAEEGVSHVKITLDGLAVSHNGSRILKNGAGTFDLVLRNLVQATEHVRTLVRVNLQASNLHSVPDLLKLLASRVQNAKFIPELDFNLVYEQTTKRLSEDINYEHMNQLQHLALDLGFLLRLPPIRRSRHCKFNSPSSFLVDTEGRLYLCDKRSSTNVGSINIKNISAAPINTDTAQHFRQTATICEQCELLPVCGGGCRMLSLGGDKPACPPWKPNFESYLGLQLRASEAAAEAASRRRK